MEGSDNFTSLTAPKANYVSVESESFTSFTTPVNGLIFVAGAPNFESLSAPNATWLGLSLQSTKDVTIDASPTTISSSLHIAAPITDISFLSNVTQNNTFSWNFYNTEIEDLSPIDRADFEFQSYVTPTFSDALSQSALEEHSYGLFGLSLIHI